MNIWARVTEADTLGERALGDRALKADYILPGMLKYSP